MSRCQCVVEECASMRLPFKMQSPWTRSQFFRKQHIWCFCVLRKNENATKKVEISTRTPRLWQWTASPASISTLFRLPRNSCDEFVKFSRRQHPYEIWCLNFFARQPYEMEFSSLLPELLCVFCMIGIFRFFPATFYHLFVSWGTAKQKRKYLKPSK